jgi:hypothetical protein
MIPAKKPITDNKIPDATLMILKSNFIFLFFLFFWFTLNVLQAAFTYLDPDEAYYWMYSKALDWGYFDHPPATAVLIKLGYSVIESELGIRLFTVLLQAFSFYGIWILVGKPTDKSKVWTLMALLVSMPLLQIYGFVATPDAPLLFCSVWFLVLYQRFLQKESWTNTLLLGFCMAALLYSKYHGVLLIFFTLLSNLKLLFKPKFYIASAFGALLFFPHLYWQYAHDFSSFRYHLAGRNDAYQFKYTRDYIINQLLLFNPFLFPIIIISIIKQPIKDALHKAFLFVIVGFWSFFLYSTSKGHVEPQWTVVLSIPFIILLYHYTIANPSLTKWIFRIGIFTMTLFLIARVGLLKPDFFELKTNFHRTAWVQELKNLSGEAPIAFENSYRDPSVYTFYSGQQAYSFADANYRKSQFDVWDWEKKLHNKTVVIAAQDSLGCNNCEQIKLTRKIFKIIKADSLQISQKVKIEFKEVNEFKAGQSVTLDVNIQNPYDHTIHFGTTNQPLQVDAIFYFIERERIKASPEVILRPPLVRLKPKETFVTQAQFTVPDSLQGAYHFGLGIQTGELAPAYNSKVFTVNISRKAAKAQRRAD